MNTSKLSISTRMAIDNNFGFPKGENGTISAFVKVNKNIDKELKDLGASIQGFMQGQTTGELFTVRFPINSLDKISEIDGLVYLDIGEKTNTMNTMNIKMPQPAPITEAVKQQNLLVGDTLTAGNVNNSFLEKHKNHLLIALALVAGYFAYKKFKK